MEHTTDTHHVKTVPVIFSGIWNGHLHLLLFPLSCTCILVIGELYLGLQMSIFTVLLLMKHVMCHENSISLV